MLKVSQKWVFFFLLFNFTLFSFSLRFMSLFDWLIFRVLFWLLNLWLTLCGFLFMKILIWRRISKLHYQWKLLIWSSSQNYLWMWRRRKLFFFFILCLLCLVYLISVWWNLLLLLRLLIRNLCINLLVWNWTIDLFFMNIMNLRVNCDIYMKISRFSGLFI